MGIKLGSNNISKVYLGSNEITKIYLGNNLIYDAIGGGAWTPLEITTALWLDASDESTITQSLGLVSQWDDKSGLGNHAIQVEGLYQPSFLENTLNGKSVISFNSDSFDFIDSTVSCKAAIWVINSIYIDTLVNIIFDNGNGEYTFIATSGSYDISIDGAGVSNSGNSSLNGNNLVFGTNINLGSGSANNRLANIWYADYTNQINGINAIANITSATGQKLRGSIAELILLTTIPSETDRQKLEGYLAHKWGLTAKLPELHPYKLSAPTV